MKTIKKNVHIEALKNIGAVCRKVRINNGYLLKDVAFDTKYCIKTISMFERGYNNSLTIFLWYLKKFDSEIMKEVK